MGHGPHSSKIMLFYILFVLYCSMYCLCVNVYCHRVTTQLQLTNRSYYIPFLQISRTECRQQNALKSVRLYQTTRCHIPKDGKFRSYSGEKVALKTVNQAILIYLTWKKTQQRCNSIPLGLPTQASDLTTGIHATTGILVSFQLLQLACCQKLNNESQSTCFYFLHCH